jgi:hypothetical protein
MKILRHLPSFQRSIDRGQCVIALHALPDPEGASFTTFIFEKAGERLLRHFAGENENEESSVKRQAQVWCDENS